MDLSIWLAFVAASAALLSVPGPTVLLVLAHALGQGRRAAVPTALGVAVGDLIAMTASLAGLGALVLTSAWAFATVKWLGAAYLVWLGARMIMSTRHGGVADPGPAAEHLSSRAAFGNAAAVTALNPKSIAFFIAFVPQFLDPAGALLPQAAILVTTFVGLALANALIYAVLAARLRGAIRCPRVIAWLTRAGGATLIAMGVALAGLRRAGA